MAKDGRHLSPVSMRSVDLDRRHSEAWEWRIKGLSPEEISREMGIARSTVFQYLRAAMDVRALPDRVHELRLDLDRLDHWLVILGNQIDKGLAVARNIEVGIKVLERRARLLGLDAPEQTSIEVTQIGQDDLEITDMIQAARARIALTEQTWAGQPTED